MMLRTWRATGMALILTIAACTPSEGPKSIPLPTSPNATTPTTPPTTASITARFEATIQRTSDGVPHIYGKNLTDTAFGQGYASNEDHGCILIDQVLRVTGQRSAFLGPGTNGENIESDFAWRSIGLAELAADDFADASRTVIDQFEAFTAGWNQAFADRGETFGSFCAGAEWVRPVTPVEVYTYARSIALLASGEQMLDFIAAAKPPVDPHKRVVDSDITVLQGDDPVKPIERSNIVSDKDVRRLLAGGFAALRPDGFSSNAWAIGAEQTVDGGGILVGNLHTMWEGPLRFAEVHLVTDNGVNVYGAQLLGLPGVTVGITDSFSWSHTLSAGNRFTVYTLDLDPDDPTRYIVDGAVRDMIATSHTIDILRPDGSVDSETRTLYSSEYGPIVDLPGIGWTDRTVLTYRDANLNNDEMIEFYAAVLTDKSLNDFIDSHAEHQGVSLFNTIAVSADGQAWYADTSATPSLSADAEERYALRLLAGDPLVSIAWDNGVILLDGSDSRFAWQATDGARDEGLVPFRHQPQLLRTDHVFNADDPYWIVNTTVTLDTDYSILHGLARQPLSMRTRQNATVIAPNDPLDLAGDDDLWTAEEARTAILDNTAGTALVLRTQVVEACRSNPIVEVVDLLAADGSVALPAETVDLTAACDVLNAWDGRYDLDRAGPLLWRETLNRFTEKDRADTGLLFGDAFDPTAPITTPSQLAEDVVPVLTALARAVQTLAIAGFEVTATLGAAQFTERFDERIALHGGTDYEGLTNVVRWSSSNTLSDEPSEPTPPVVPGGTLRDEGYPINFGTNFLFVVDYTDDDVAATAIATAGRTTGDGPTAIAADTVRFAEKNWRRLPLTEEAITADDKLVKRVVIGR